jgi:glycosyltransferase involved in cell wall biosynthesis
MNDKHVIYASATDGVHDRRWVEALRACGFEVAVMAASADLRASVDAFEPLSAPVLAGPLNTVTELLVGLSRPVIGLSWGYDLQQGHSRAVPLESLAWISSLDGLVVDSPATRDLAISLGLAADRIVLIPWGVDLELFTPIGPEVSAAAHGFASGSRVVLSLRTHDTLYRTSDVIEAFARAALVDPALVLVMGGDGPLTPAHHARVAELGLESRVRFIERVDETELPALLRGAELYVTASETDGTSVTLLQAMACGVPVIASRNAGNDTWIRDGETGRLFDVGDIESFASLLVPYPRDTKSPDTRERALALVIEDANWKRNRLRLLDMLKHLGPNT